VPVKKLSPKIPSTKTYAVTMLTVAIPALMLVVQANRALALPVFILIAVLVLVPIVLY
jgi:hypothetical protein